MSRYVLFVLLLFGLSAGCQSVRTNDLYFMGVSFVGTGDKVTTQHVEKVKSIHANAVTLMPFAYGVIGKPELVFKDLAWQWWGESTEGVRHTAKLAKEEGLLVMIKPHLWLDWGSYTGDHGFDSESDWQAFEQGYKEYVLQFAHISEELELPVFCIGTELARSARTRPEFWRSLIAEIREVYSGQLTYAANWDSYKHIAFWNELDFIGVDAYFPLDSSATPSHPALLRGWEQWHSELETLSNATGRPVIFTEWGYRSADHSAKKPWEYDELETKVNFEAQTEAYRALLDNFSDESWFSGGFVWKWFPHHDQVGGSGDNQYTPQNKPAEDVLKKHFQSLRR